MTRRFVSMYLIRWLLLLGLIFLYLSLGGASRDYHSESGLVVNLGATICLGGLLLLPTSSKPLLLLLNALVSVTSFILYLVSVIEGGIPSPILWQCVLAVLCISLLLHSLSGLLLDFGVSSRTAVSSSLIFALLIGGAILWMAPAVELFVLEQDIIDTIIASSPLTYLSVAAEYDYLRNEWFYRHSPFGSLRFSYPSYPLLTIVYLGLAIGIHKIPSLFTRINENYRFTTHLDIQGDIKR